MLLQIRIQIFTSMRIRIKGAKPMRIHADPEPGQNFALKKVKFLNEKLLNVGNR
jgi:hypothetical protein